jgi:hypothetical protein
MGYRQHPLRTDVRRTLSGASIDAWREKVEKMAGEKRKERIDMSEEKTREGGPERMETFNTCHQRKIKTSTNLIFYCVEGITVPIFLFCPSLSLPCPWLYLHWVCLWAFFYALVR